MRVVAEDCIEQLQRASGLAVASRATAAAAWNGLLATAREQWPRVHFDDAVLAPHIGGHLLAAPGQVDDLAAVLAAAPAGDLALAAACTAQEPTAHAAFDAVLAEVDAAGNATGASADLVEEVKQLLRVQLLVAKDGKPPGIAAYRGKGPLRGWVRITATRELIRHKKKQQRAQPLDQGLDQLLTSRIDPGLEALKAEYRSEFAVALRDAIATISPEDRTLLRQQIVDGMSIDEVGAAFGVHRATAARWLNRARGSLVSATHQQLAKRLELPVEQIESVIRLVHSQLDASVVRYLRER
jgi:RNA polymerase sigma-70 factor (ECF subfamily)